MAVSTAFTTGEAIIEAFERLLTTPEKVDGPRITSAKRSIRLLLEEWENDQVKLWNVVSTTTTTIDGTATYALAAGAIDLLEIYLRRSGIDTPISVMSRSEYFGIPDKDEEGRPTRVWVDRSTDPPTMYPWPVPENSTDVFVYNYIDSFNASTSPSGTPDLSRGWQEAFIAGLTAKLAEKWARPLLGEKTALATIAYRKAKMGERERADTRMVIRRRAC